MICLPAAVEGFGFFLCRCFPVLIFFVSLEEVAQSATGLALLTGEKKSALTHKKADLAASAAGRAGGLFPIFHP